MQDYLFTDEDFINNLSIEKPGIFKKIYEEIKYLVKVATAGSKEAKQLEKVKRAFEKVYKQISNSTDSDVKYLLETTEDKKLYQYVQDALDDKLPKKSYYKISESISDRMAKDIEGIVGFSVQGYGNEISPNSIRHIRNEHGENGTTDNSMKDYHDLAKIAYVIEHYDKMREGKKSEEFRNSDGTYAKTIELQKKIDDNFYYVVEAVPDAKNKTLHIVSAYNNKKDTFSDELVSNDPKRYVLDEHQPNVSFNNIVPRNAKMSISDNKGRTLTKEQQNFLKDSRVDNTAPTSSDDIRYSLSGENKNIAPVGSYNVHGKDLLLEALDDIRNRATSHETTDNKQSQPAKVQNDYTPNPEVYETEVMDTEKLIDAKIEIYKAEHA